jgi:hypothetical protein
MADIKWECPKCHAQANAHGKGGRDECAGRGALSCPGFICECEDEGSEDHGTSFANQCPEARCYHCNWSGTFPAKPKGLLPWEKKALTAGWTMPAARAKELGLK